MCIALDRSFWYCNSSRSFQKDKIGMNKPRPRLARQELTVEIAGKRMDPPQISGPPTKPFEIEDSHAGACHNTG